MTADLASVAPKGGDIAGRLRTSRRGMTYGRRGSGTPVVLVHGWCLDRTVWMYLEESLVAEGYEVITPALAGYGASAGLAGPYTLARHADDLADLLDELDLDGALLVGFAYGAAALLDLPRFTRVAGMALIGVPSAAGAPYPKMRRAMLRDWPLFAQRSARAICHVGHSDATRAWLGGVFAATPLECALAGVDELAAFEPDRPQRWTIPTVFVHGSQDAIVSVDVSRDCADRYEGAEFTEVPDCGHFVPLDQPTALLAAVVRLAGRAGGTS
jgi:pimeloyl-ACP methyl ester carboxylesterase